MEIFLAVAIIRDVNLQKIYKLYGTLRKQEKRIRRIVKSN